MVKASSMGSGAISLRPTKFHEGYRCMCVSQEASVRRRERMKAAVSKVRLMTRLNGGVGGV